MSSSFFTFAATLSAGAFRFVPFCKGNISRARDVTLGLATLAQIIEALTNSDRSFRQ